MHTNERGTSYPAQDSKKRVSLSFFVFFSLFIRIFAKNKSYTQHYVYTKARYFYVSF